MFKHTYTYCVCTHINFWKYIFKKLETDIHFFNTHESKYDLKSSSCPPTYKYPENYYVWIHYLKQYQLLLHIKLMNTYKKKILLFKFVTI